MVAPYAEPGPFDSARRARSAFSSDYSLLSPTSTRSSVLPSVVLPYLRRLDISDDMAINQKTPLLTLKLSSPSFLDSVVHDEFTRHPLYVIETRSTKTTVVRSDPWEGTTDTAKIEWPKLLPLKGKGKSDIDSVLVKMRGGRYQSGGSVLRSGSLMSAPRKFNIPGYSRSLKWKPVGNSFWCISSSVKGPIATFDPAIDNVPPRLKVFETLHDKYDARPLLVHHGVSILLLDYLVVTALLLVTDVQEWMVVKKYEGEISPISPSRSLDSGGPGSATTSTSASQWRKIMYGEPMYPKKRNSSSTTPPPSEMVVPPTPTSVGQMAKIMYGEPIYPSLKTASPSVDASVSDSGEESDDHEDNDADEVKLPPTNLPPQPSRAPSPSAESVCYPLTNTSAPSHTYLDPMFYNEHDVPPVPPLPLQYSSSSRTASPTLLTSGRSQEQRSLPRPPPLHSASYDIIPRSRSTPPQEDALSSSHSLALSTSAPGSRRPSYNPPVRTLSMSSRRLPTPPTTAPIDTRHHVLRHSQSTNKPLNVQTREKRMSHYAPRSLPPTPISPVSAPVQHSDFRRASEHTHVHRQQQLQQQQPRRRMRKGSHGDLSEAWLASAHDPHHPDPAHGQGNALFDTPPPAYNTINFDAGYEMTISSAPPLPPPPPPRSLPRRL